MKKSIIAIILVAATIFCVPTAFAFESVENQDVSIQQQIDAAIAAVDEDALRRDAMENVIDYSVPASIRESIEFGAELTSEDIAYKDQFELGEVNSTVQKVGEINYRNGEIAPIYVAVAAATVKEDYGSNSRLLARAWTTVYWIDNEGPSNEIYAAEARWDTSNCNYAFSNKKVKYGTSLPGGFSLLNYSTVNVNNSSDACYVPCAGEYIGLALACVSEMDIGPSPVKLTCWAVSNVMT